MFGGWVDNGDGSYTSGGAANDTLRWDGIGVIAGQSYQVDYRVSGGSVSLKLNGGSAHPVTGSGSLLLDDATSDGVQFVSLTGEITTVHRLSVRRVLPRYGPELWNDAEAHAATTSEILGGGAYRVYSPDGSNSYVGMIDEGDPTKTYEVSFTIDQLTTPGQGVGFEGVPQGFSTLGRHTVIGSPANGNLIIKRMSPTGETDIQISDVSIREIL